MKARLMILPDFTRGGAWPPSVRTVGRSVKSDNERDPCPYLPTHSQEGAHYRGTARANLEEGGATVGQYAPNPPGYTRATKGGTMGIDTERCSNPETYS